MPHFQLVTTDGKVLGARELGRPDWPPGSVIYTGGPDEANLRVVNVIAAADPERSSQCSSSKRSSSGNTWAGQAPPLRVGRRT